MDLLALSTQAIGFVGDFLGAVTQDLTSNYLSNLVAQRLGQSEPGAEALQRLQEQPGDQNRRIAASSLLAELAESDPQFAEQLFRAVEQAHRAQQVRVQQGTSQLYVGADQTVTASGKGAIGVDLSTVHNQTVNKRSWMIALTILGVIGALMLISFTLVQVFGNSEQSRVEDVAVQFMRAAALDPTSACALFASNSVSREVIEDVCARTGPENPWDLQNSRRWAESVRTDSVEITSDTTARARMVSEKGYVVLHLTRENGQWKIFSADEVS